MVDSVLRGWFGGGMKATLFALFVALLMVGCGDSEKVDLCDEEITKEILASAVTLDYDTFQRHNGFLCLIGSEEPFTGWAKGLWENGQVSNLTKIEDGLGQRVKEWRRNGKPLRDMSLIGVNLATVTEINEIIGFHSREGRTKVWYENGQKAKELDFNKGKLMSAVIWTPNGEKCPVTNVVDGNGVMVEYNEDGSERSRDTYKDGERVYD